MKETTLCYIENSGRYLMLLRNKKKNDPNKNKWIGVGGKLQPGETPEMCIKREISEETGLSNLPLRYVGKINFSSDIWEDELMHLFVAKSSSDKITPCPEGTLKWIKKEDILSLDLWEGDKIFLRRIIEGNFEKINLTLLYKGETLVSVEE